MITIPNRFKKGKQDAALSQQIITESDLSKYCTRARLIGLMYHVDTYKKENGDWRPQGYVYIKDLINLCIDITTGKISTIDDEHILFFSFAVSPSSQNKEDY
jgi:hypothetical protein